MKKKIEKNKIVITVTDMGGVDIVAKNVPQWAIEKAIKELTDYRETMERFNLTLKK